MDNGIEVKTCKLKGCGGVLKSRGFCNRHHLQWKKGYLSETGYRLKEITERQRSVRRYPEGAVCKMADCGGRAKKNYFCNTHYDQVRRGIIDREGNVLRPIRPARPSYVNNNGYRLIYAPDYLGQSKGNYVLEHRMVLEEKLGRPLKAHESVHHLDGDKLNNDPDNLELRTTRSHGEGHAWTPAEVIEGLEALRLQNPKGYRMALRELGLTEKKEND